MNFYYLIETQISTDFRKEIKNDRILICAIRVNLRFIRIIKLYETLCGETNSKVIKSAFQSTISELIL